MHYSGAPADNTDDWRMMHQGTAEVLEQRGGRRQALHHMHHTLDQLDVLAARGAGSSGTSRIAWFHSAEDEGMQTRLAHKERVATYLSIIKASESGAGL